MRAAVRWRVDASKAPVGGAATWVSVPVPVTPVGGPSSSCSRRSSRGGGGARRAAGRGDAGPGGRGAPSVGALAMMLAAAARS
jgi:hypothetical protein